MASLRVESVTPCEGFARLIKAFVDPELAEGVGSLLLLAFLPLELCFAEVGFPSFARGGVAVDLAAAGGFALDTISGAEGVD